jgi:tetratricopeptide (TPR) repeat protein
VPSLLPLLLFALLSLSGPGAAAAQGTADNAEARVYFEEGNRLYQEASRARGEKRTALFQRSLEAYVDSLQIVRSRNALFNAAIVLGELERYDEAFNYFTEYLAVEGLSAEDRTEAESRRNALRSKVAVLRVTAEPEGAMVWIDRKDLAPRGETPIELALPEGTHTAYVEKEGYVPVEQAQRLVKGESTTVVLSLAAMPEPPAVEPTPLDLPAPPENLRLRNAAIGTAAATLATAATAIGLSVKGRSLRDEANAAAAQYRMTGDPADRQRAEDLADRTDRFNIAADVLWGTTIALGVSAIVLCAVHQKKKREAPEVAVSVSRNGGYASLTLPFGARP